MHTGPRNWLDFCTSADASAASGFRYWIFSLVDKLVLNNYCFRRFDTTITAYNFFFGITCLVIRFVPQATACCKTSSNVKFVPLVGTAALADPPPCAPPVCTPVPEFCFTDTCQHTETTYARLVRSRQWNIT
jgi:hypothetical protein